MTYDEWLAQGRTIVQTYRDSHSGVLPACPDVDLIRYRQAFESARFPTLAHAMHEAWGSPMPPFPGRRGRVRQDGRCFADDDGPWLALGLPLFWAVRGSYDGELARVRANAEWARAQGADFVRVFAETLDWVDDDAGFDRRTDPRWPGYAAHIRAVRDVCADEGLRIAWTLFGGNVLSADEQSACVETVLEVLDWRPETVLTIEIANENQGFGDAGGVARMREFATRVAAHSYPVTLTSAAHVADPITLYTGSGATWVTIHPDRRDGERGWRWTRQMYPGPGEFGLPVALFGTLEPGGPGASVHSDMDPERIAAAAVNTWMVGGAVHVVHCGAGIYGVPSTHPEGGARPANLWEQASLAEALAIIRERVAVLPPDLPTWTRENHGWPGHPYSFPREADGYYTTVGDRALERGQGCVRAFAAHRDGRFVCHVTGTMRVMDLEARHATQHATLLEEDGRARVLVGDYR